ncbi:hypothetical protein DNHGIG_25110 [Collibacillus ludicampi]|uniref:Type II toxin-antitoxin system PemK/MazF family toxin n=1 Tax=Collibacillus ludicampi TaxID=2771369 RepID=A0AAV4LHS0_9BACL|nr:hypothetical protein DNHGIG_25110 [Collibacillus ludicampi]
MIRNKIVLVPFPFDDLSSVKVRPAVCLTEPIGPHQHVILAFITSRIPDDLQTSDIVLEQGTSVFEPTGLKVTSTIRLHRLMTVTTSYLKRELGELANSTVKEISDRLQQLFVLAN